MLELARQAASLWPFRVRDIALVAHRENAVFRIDSGDGRRFALRLHRIGYRTAEELHSELQFMAALQAGGLDVPKPVASRSGGFIEQINGTPVSVLSWAAGRPLGQHGKPLELADRTGTFFRLGEAQALLHEIADHWPRPAAFTRQSWDVAGLLGEQPQWGRFWDNPMLTHSQRETVLAVREKLAIDLRSRPDLDFGLIHADLLSENILVDGERLCLIDFDDSGFGYRLQDIATALVKHDREPDYSELEAALVDGYRGRRALDVSFIPAFLLIRNLSLLGWIVPRMEQGGGAARNAALIETVMPLAEQYLRL